MQACLRHPPSINLHLNKVIGIITLCKKTKRCMGMWLNGVVFACMPCSVSTLPSLHLDSVLLKKQGIWVSNLHSPLTPPGRFEIEASQGSSRFCPFTGGGDIHILRKENTAALVAVIQQTTSEDVMEQPAFPVLLSSLLRVPFLMSPLSRILVLSPPLRLLSTFPRLPFSCGSSRCYLSPGHHSS